GEGSDTGGVQALGLHATTAEAGRVRGAGAGATRESRGAGCWPARARAGTNATRAAAAAAKAAVTRILQRTCMLPPIGGRWVRGAGGTLPRSLPLRAFRDSAKKARPR